MKSPLKTNEITSYADLTLTHNSSTQFHWSYQIPLHFPLCLALNSPFPNQILLIKKCRTFTSSLPNNLIASSLHVQVIRIRQTIQHSNLQGKISCLHEHYPPLVQAKEVQSSRVSIFRMQWNNQSRNALPHLAMTLYQVKSLNGIN